MKLHYTKLLLFFFTLNILLTSYHAHNKNKPSITPHHTRSTTSRLLSEYDTESSIYDSDDEIDSVKEIFERQASQRLREYDESSLKNFITTENYLDATIIVERVKVLYESLPKEDLTSKGYFKFHTYRGMGEEEGTQCLLQEAKIIVEESVERASKETIKATATEMQTIQAGKLAQITETSYNLYSAIGYSVLDILIIVLVMIIIYLVLHYRRKKKMNKKAQYTKLLNQ
ncbi:hypothetical protein PFFCH_00545 [Plasmodium falciparum FCH/4]|uniref:Surface antigen n=1 Tax=Plasmodium falciparum FCH/4 TaxID=1036724 RepID=A0A024VTG1_PLAFA|nr:hypothetical protein PFFCH_00545 [Plasmodium falciparum FCH/4]